MMSFLCIYCLWVKDRAGYDYTLASVTLYPLYLNLINNILLKHNYLE